jgi:NitT/TauT family transport system permease protein/sulfonate transport system permease protein
MKKLKPGQWANIGAGCFSIGTFLVLWYLATAFTHLGELMPGPQAVILSFFKSFIFKVGRHTILVHAFYSLSRVLIGYTIASALGISLGLVMGWNRTAEAIFQPLFRIIRPIPPIAWIPISIIWFGLGESAKYFLIFLAAFTSVTLNAWAGARAVDPQIMGAARMLGANRKQLFFTIVLPSSIPHIFAGMQIAMSSSWATVLAAEMVRSSEGLGWMIVSGMNNNDMVQILMGIVAIGIIGFILSIIMRKLEEVLCRWNKSGQ